MDQMKYLKELAVRYPDIASASTEIINLQAILNLPKGTEHYVSDLHGEYEMDPGRSEARLRISSAILLRQKRRKISPLSFTIRNRRWI